MVIKLQIYTSRGIEGLNIQSLYFFCTPVSSGLSPFDIKFISIAMTKLLSTFDLTLHYLDCDLLLAFLRVRLVLVSVAGLD